MENNSTQESIKKTNPLLVVLFWLYVGIPLAWGVYNTLLKTVHLFK
jgi:ABC-type amino acid transport system permease subunit